MRDSHSQDWDKPEHIPDPDAKKPEDWDEEMDGEWEPPVIQNPEYKVRWARPSHPLFLAACTGSYIYTQALSGEGGDRGTILEL